MWRLTDSCCHEILAIDWKTVPGGILLNSSKVSKKYPMPVFHQIMWRHMSEMKLGSNRKQACVKTAESRREKRGNSTFNRSEPSLTALSPFSRDVKELSGKALSRVGLELWLTWQPVVLIMLLGDDDDDKVMMMSAATDNSGVDDEANLMTFFSRWNELKLD